MEERIVLRVVSRFLIPFIVLYGLYIQFHGDYSPGGGFQAGVICASAFILYSLIHGLPAMLKVIPFSVIRVFCSAGPLIYASVGVIGLLQGHEFLNYSHLAETAPHGQERGIFLVELGVGLTVFSVIMMIYVLFSSRKQS